MRDDIAQRTRGGARFFTSTEGDAWMARWCERCLREAPFGGGIDDTECPLLRIARNQDTPAELSTNTPELVEGPR